MERRRFFKKYSGALFLTALFCCLVFFYLPSFNNPPRSDYWVALYHFQLADDSTSPLSQISLCNYDPWEHGTFRPLAHPLLYLEHKLFGTNFIWNHLINFFMYCLSIVFLYLLARKFSLDKYLTAAFLTVYAFLFSHFDIVTWTFQIFSTMSFVSILLGFLLYIKFLESGKRWLLVVVTILFLFGMFCFELYAFWPPAIIILTLGRRFFLPPNPARTQKKLLRAGGLLLGVVYGLYIAGFFLTRLAENTSGNLPKPDLGMVTLGICSVFFNLLYNGILVNLVPFVTEPLVIKDNLDMAGLLVGWYNQLGNIIYLTGGAALLLLGTGAGILYRRKKQQTLFILAFFMFLLFTYFFSVTVSRLTTNAVWYVFCQFRYQYTPNALLALMVVTILSKLVRPGRRGKIIISCLLLIIISVNLHLAHKYMTVIDIQLEPLGRLLSNIRSGIEAGEINSRAKLYIEDEITASLPPICWNEDMARFMDGSYQWFFSKKELACFTFSLPEAAWIIRENDHHEICRAYPAKVIEED